MAVGLPGTSYPDRMSVALIRPAHGGDVDAIHEVHLACWQEAYAEHLPQWVFERRQQQGRAQWEETLQEPSGVWIAHRDGTAVGFAHASSAGAGAERALELSKLYVRASEYGAGTAGNLLHVAIGDAPCQVWVAHYNTRAQRFYEKMGFHIDDRADANRREAQWDDLWLLRMLR